MDAGEIALTIIIVVAGIGFLVGIIGWFISKIDFSKRPLEVARSKG